MANVKYIDKEEFISLVNINKLYCGYVVGEGYAYYGPLIIKPEKFRDSVLLDGEYTVAWCQKIDNSPEMKMKSLKQESTKWSDVIGSTKLQRFAAREFAKEHHGTISNENKSCISVIYKEIIAREQFFNDNGTLISQHGEIKELNRLSLTYFEMWLSSQSESAFGAIHKALCSMGYSVPNSCSILFRSKTLSGSPVVNSNDKVNALIDIGPGIILKLIKTVGMVSKVGKGLQGYNQYLKRNQHLKSNTSLLNGTTWRQNAGKSFRTDQYNYRMTNQVNEFLDNMNKVNTIYKEYKKID